MRVRRAAKRKALGAGPPLALTPLLALALTLALAPLLSSAAAACPICDTGTGAEVRAGLLNEHLGRNLLATLLPFPVLGAIVALIYFGPPGARRPGRGPADARAEEPAGPADGQGGSSWSAG